MPNRLVTEVLPLVRRAVRERKAIWPWLGWGASAPDGALAGELYDGAYFGAGRNPASREGRSGYERYDRKSSRAEVAAFLAWRHFPAERTLDVGCAFGFVVEALRELGVKAYGVDFSKYAVEHAAAPARDFVQYGDLLAGLPFRDGEFDLVTAFEVLEHLPPASVPAAVRELRRICGGHLLASMPSIGSNPYGPRGWYEGKVRPERLAHYRLLPDSYEGPIPEEDLARDAGGRPVEGHQTIASFSWWTRAFEAGGFARDGELERRLVPDLDRFGRAGMWNAYVFAVPGAARPAEARRTPEEIEAVEALWSLDALELAIRLRREIAVLLGPAYPLSLRALAPAQRVAGIVKRASERLWSSGSMR
jgi:SAM-dependent methyltransferase